MPLSTKLRAEYTELANQYLDHIPVKKPKDFEVIKEALKSITEPHENHLVKASLADRVKDIKALIDQPELYVQKNENYSEFKTIILQRVAAKIKEFDGLNSSEKEKYLADQKELKEKTTQNQTEIASHQAPTIGSEAHTISEQEWFQQQQALFQQPSWNVPQAQQLPHAEVEQQEVQLEVEMEIEIQSHESLTQQLPPISQQPSFPTLAEIGQRQHAVMLRLQQIQTQNNVTIQEIIDIQREMNEISVMQEQWTQRAAATTHLIN